MQEGTLEISKQLIKNQELLTKGKRATSDNDEPQTVKFYDEPESKKPRP